MPTKDVREMTILEYIYAPITFSNIAARRGKRAYQYYDTPDGQDIWKKLWVSGKWSLGIGAFITTIDLRMYSNPKTILEGLNRAAYINIPIVSAFTTYTAITYAATSLRNKDDPINSLIGGMAAGSLLGYMFKAPIFIWPLAVMTGAFCCVRKDGFTKGYVMGDLNNVQRIYGNHRSPHHDSSLFPVGEKGWTTGA
ncbi:uncharacterized protein [Neodiprion pinetum]|uniref:NADH dehydrogenase [ubiquinone] 1 alpha subcomplex subunit 11 n=1 Tax=Neodiprion lecontei TaxID=441921 RepID=A0A6J0C946_NEOLC|nr:uncharacterized protein LOC107227299 [Neodiprion lecontei]XP_015523892.1 uncharacterized protein LOC107227299 [Neodiprion lecontei]XP_046428253.1 uncharacterized protein LOC124183609 [Neodiprion fabricii]XP_046428254.1 uncharacterized protein LOC124183609 [Neodiprion fabricii]XP_046484191.1 uncharacterized protein LOC124219959 [Neodiprion pinetum]XP_046484192.1 uncharacterized protein LOC124219959 [Neodiprion pinetum]